MLIRTICGLRLKKNTPKYGCSAIPHNTGKGPASTPSFKQPHVKHVGQSTHGGHGNNGGNGGKDASSSKGPWVHMKDDTSNSKSLSKSAIQIQYKT